MQSVGCHTNRKDCFTVSLHSTNSRLLLELCKGTVSALWHKVGIPTSYIIPQYIAANPLMQWTCRYSPICVFILANRASANPVDHSCSNSPLSVRLGGVLQGDNCAYCYNSGYRVCYSMYSYLYLSISIKLFKIFSWNLEMVIHCISRL